MTVYTVWIVNKSGGLAYQRTVHEGFHPRLSSNDYLVLASTFQRYGARVRLLVIHVGIIIIIVILIEHHYSVHAITINVSPVEDSSGFESMEWQGAEPFTIHCLHPLTGLKILVTASPQHPNVPALLRRIYECYADYALKNPFHTPEMPIRSELFDRHLLEIVK